MERPGVTEKTIAAEPADTAPKPIDHAPPAEPERVPSVSESVTQQGLPSFTQPTPAQVPTVPVEPEEPAIVVEDTSKPTESAKTAVYKEGPTGTLLYLILCSHVCVAHMFSFRCGRETRCLAEDSEGGRQ